MTSRGNLEGYTRNQSDPQPIDDSEKGLPRAARTTLAQLSFGYSSFLISFKQGWTTPILHLITTSIVLPPTLQNTSLIAQKTKPICPPKITVKKIVLLIYYEDFKILFMIFFNTIYKRLIFLI